jgi:hypothetical protein
MKTTKTLLSLFLLMLFPASYAQDAFLCVAIKSTGFSYSNSTKSWEHARFKVGDERKLLKKVGDTWEWRDFGRNFGEQCGRMNEHGWINCDFLLGSMRFRRKSLRYIETYTIGYTSGIENNENTPAITIGTCTPL